MKNINNKRALSPVIATVILVAVAITVAVAVAYWMGGIAGQYTKFEKVEIQSILCEKDEDGYWNVTMSIKNTGTATATIDKVFVNNLELVFDNTAPPDNETAAYYLYSTGSGAATLTLTSGQTGTVVIMIDEDWQTVSSGTTINIKLHSTGGMEYLKMVELV